MLKFFLSHVCRNSFLVICNSIYLFIFVTCQEDHSVLNHVVGNWITIYEMISFDLCSNTHSLSSHISHSFCYTSLMSH